MLIKYKNLLGIFVILIMGMPVNSAFAGLPEEVSTANAVPDITVKPSAIIPTITVTSPDGLISKGWNLISLPAKPVNGDPEVVMNGIDLSFANLQLWDNADQTGGRYFIYKINWDGYMQPSQGYWMTLTSAVQIKYSAIPNNDPSTTVEIPAHVKAPYWIMIANPYNKPVKCADIKFFTGDDPSNAVGWDTAARVKGWIESTAIGWSNQGQCYINASTLGISDRDSLEPWYAYWMMVKTTQKLSIVFPNK